jgi:hypothetical protein
MEPPPNPSRSEQAEPGPSTAPGRLRSVILVPALLATLALVVALGLELSRSNSPLRRPFLSGDARQAVAAAELGFQRFLEELNSENNHYLLVTRLANATGSGDWQSVTRAELARCGIKAPPRPPSADRIPGVSTNSSDASVVLPGDGSASYSLIGYDPPAQKQAPRRGCSMFGDLQGGPARLTVRGTVQRHGTVYATYDLEREVTIRTEAQLAENQLGLVITGPPDRSRLGTPFNIVHDEDGDGAIGTTGRTLSEPLGNVNCVLCTSPAQLDTRGTSLASVIVGPIRNFPPFPALPPELVDVSPAPNLDEDHFGVPVFYPNNYPYNHPTSTKPAVGLVSGCKYLSVDGIANAEIGCKISQVSGFGTIRVRADVRPVRLFVSGPFIISGEKDLRLTDGNAATPEAQDALRYWKNLWIYGKPGTPDAKGSNCNQEVSISASGDAFGGRLWFPLGKASVRGGSFGRRDFIGSLWTCIFNQGSDNTGFLIPGDLVETWNLDGGAGGGHRYRALGAL